MREPLLHLRPQKRQRLRLEFLALLLDFGIEAAGRRAVTIWNRARRAGSRLRDQAARSGNGLSKATESATGAGEATVLLMPFIASTKRLLFRMKVSYPAVGFLSVRASAHYKVGNTVRISRRSSRNSGEAAFPSRHAMPRSMQLYVA